MESKKPSLAIAIGVPKKPPVDDTQADDGPSPEDMQDARMTSAQSLIEAVKAGDAAAVDEALKSHYDACEGEG